LLLIPSQRENIRDERKGTTIIKDDRRRWSCYSPQANLLSFNSLLQRLTKSCSSRLIRPFANELISTESDNIIEAEEGPAR